MAIPLIDYVPTLYFPKEKRYPFDGVAIRIVVNLYKRNWQVPGIKVVFRTIGTGQEKWTLVDKIVGYGPAKNEPDSTGAPPHRPNYKGDTELFTLQFARAEGPAGKRWSPCGGLHEIVFREERLTVYNDDSGPSYELYVGPGSPYYPPNQAEFAAEAERLWYKNLEVIEDSVTIFDEETARQKFMHDSLVLMRFMHEPRIALSYKNSEYGGALKEGAMMVNDDDYDNDYRALPSEPQRIDLFKIYRHFQERLSCILQQIEQTPEVGTVNHYAYHHPERAIPIDSVRHWLGDVYAAVDSDIYGRILEERQNGPDAILPHIRYALPRGKYRLANLSVSGAPRVAYDGFGWYGKLVAPLDEVLTKRQYENGRVIDIQFGHADAESYLWGLVQVKPKYANDCYVADNAAYLRARDQTFQKIAPRDRLTDDELNEIELARAKTIVPLVDYDGTYEQPFLLINRELDFDEVEPVGKYSPEEPPAP